MKDLIDKLSSYNIFNYFLPGILFVGLAEKVASSSLIQENLMIGLFLYYFIGLWCMNWRFFRMGRLNKDRLLSRLGMTFLRKNLCLLFQGTCFGQPIVLPPFRQAPSPISPSLSSRVSGA